MGALAWACDDAGGGTAADAVLDAVAAAAADAAVDAATDGVADSATDGVADSATDGVTDSATDMEISEDVGGDGGAVDRCAEVLCSPGEICDPEAGICVAGAGWLLFLIPGAHSAREADELWRRVEGLQVELEELGPEASLPVYDEMVELARRAVLLQPDRVDFRYWRIVFEWSRAFRSEEATLPPEARRGIEATPALRAAAAAAQAELLELRHLAPTFGPLWSIAGQLGVRWLGDPDAARWIHRGRELAPHHPATCIASAVQLLREGDEAAALETFRRAIEMGARPRAVIEIFQLDLGRLDLALELARGDLGLLIHLDRLVTESGGEESLAAALRIELRDQLELACERHDAEPWMLSLLARRLVEEGEGAGAVALYRRYLNQVPDSPLRFDLARALVGLERIEEARQELRDLLAIEPGHEGARELLRTLDGS